MLVCMKSYKYSGNVIKVVWDTKLNDVVYKPALVKECTSNGDLVVEIIG